MPTIPDSVWEKYRELSALFITEVNKTTITLHFTQNTVTTIDNPNNFQPPNIESYGGRVPVASMDGRIQEGGSNVRESDVTESIIVRLYWTNNKIFDQAKQINVMDSKNAVKIICYATDANKLQQAKYITTIHEGVSKQLIMTIPPVFYGMGGQKTYAISFWEESNG